MLNGVINVIIIFLTAAVELSVFPILFPNFAAPDLLLLFVTYHSIAKGFILTWKYAVFAGALADLIFWNPLGLHIAAFIIVAYLAGSLAKRFLVAHQPWNFLMLICFSAGASFISNGVIFILIGLLAATRPEWESIYQAFEPGRFILSSLSTGVAFAVFYWPLLAITRYFQWFRRADVAHSKIH